MNFLIVVFPNVSYITGESVEGRRRRARSLNQNQGRRGDEDDDGNIVGASGSRSEKLRRSHTEHKDEHTRF
ncbi:hypothetical protein NL676_009900 [Syzygium grande]|nr:hypothetical protein NL676_009900 [Syzygium grande]